MSDQDESNDERAGVFIVDPIEGLLRCAIRRCPALNVRVQFTDDDMPEGALGYTSLPPDEEWPTIISLRHDLAGMVGILDVLAHELAHAITGTTHDDDTGHGQEWRDAYEGLNADYIALDGYLPLREVKP